jgi:hypothetical protein
MLHYDETIGRFLWIIPRKGTEKDSFAGNERPDKYRRIIINGRAYYEHRLAWLYVHGEFPKYCIDHINRNPSDNRICNLRLATQKQNLENQSMNRKNTSGFTGVSWTKSRNRYRATITHNKKQYHLGFFLNAEDASKAYKKAAKEIFTHST